MKIYSAENIRQWDTFTIQNEPISSLNLMERAATLCTKQILGKCLFESVSIFCGMGNNGGDGLVIARLLAQRDIQVKVYLVEFSDNRSADFSENLKQLPKSIELISLTKDSFAFELSTDLTIDAIFGSGLNRHLNGWLAELVQSINQQSSKTISIDIPSGLFAEGILPENGTAIKAKYTFSFQCPKMSFFYPEHHNYLGEWKIVNIGLHPSYEAKEEATFIQKNLIQLKPNQRHDHKGTNGFLSVVAGLGGMPGAAILASKAAYRCGTGYVACTSNNDYGYGALLTHLPEVLLIDPKEQKLPQKTSAVLIGPGMGKKENSLEWLMHVLELPTPLILDADALNLLAEDPNLLSLLAENTILTPHLGELKRLIGPSSNSHELLHKQREFSKKHKVFILQKGPNSKLSCPDGSLYINSSGNPGMATAGMGDALSGMIGAFLAQGYTAKDSAINGMYLHGLAGDLAAQKLGMKGMISSDVVEQIPIALNSFI